MTLDDVGPGVTTQRYHNNGRLIMLEVNCIKFSQGIQNSLGMIMYEFYAFQSKTEGIAASVRIFLEHLSYIPIGTLSFTKFAKCVKSGSKLSRLLISKISKIHSV